MRCILVPDNPREEELLRSHPAARVLFDPLLPVLQARAIVAAVRCGLFEAMGSEPRTVDELAAELALDADVLELTLRVLTCAGYAQGDGRRYRATDVSQMTLCRRSPQRLTAWIGHNEVHWQVVSGLEKVLREGGGLDAHRCLGGSSEWATYQEAMLETARPVAGWIAENVPVRAGAERLLDLGGSHGLYGAAICRRHPPLRSEVLDLPEAVDSARELARGEGIADIVKHRAADVLNVELGEEAVDVVFLGNLVHHFTAAQNAGLIHRIGSALRAGGTIAIWDFKRPAAAEPPDLVADGLALLFRIGSSTRCYGESEYTGWLEDHGFEQVRAHPAPSPAQVLVTGRVP